MVDFGPAYEITPILATVFIMGAMLWGAVRWMNTRMHSEMKKMVDETINDVKTYSENRYNKLDTVETKIGKVNDTVIKTLDDLKRRAEFTNGAVSNIRVDSRRDRVTL